MLEKSHRVANPHSPPDLGRDVLDKRDVVVIQPVRQVKSVYRNDVREVLCRDNVRARDIEHAVAGGRGFVRKHAVLIADRDKLWALRSGPCNARRARSVREAVRYAAAAGRPLARH